MAIVFLGLGSNVGNCLANIEKAVELLKPSIKKLKQAPLYVSRPVGFTDQPDFVNSAIKGETELSPEELLNLIQSIEKRVGRVKRFRWGPREIDIDILFYDDLVIKKQVIKIPHPRINERDFVLKPIKYLDPKFIDPVTKLSISQLLENLDKDKMSVIHRLNK